MGPLMGPHEDFAPKGVSVIRFKDVATSLYYRDPPKTRPEDIKNMIQVNKKMLSPAPDARARRFLATFRFMGSAPHA